MKFFGDVYDEFGNFVGTVKGTVMPGDSLLGGIAFFVVLIAIGYVILPIVLIIMSLVALVRGQFNKILIYMGIIFVFYVFPLSIAYGRDAVEFYQVNSQNIKSLNNSQDLWDDPTSHYPVQVTVTTNECGSQVRCRYWSDGAAGIAAIEVTNLQNVKLHVAFPEEQCQVTDKLVTRSEWTINSEGKSETFNCRLNSLLEDSNNICMTVRAEPIDVLTFLTREKNICLALP